MVNKKGQITIFIIIAVLLVAVIGIIFLARNSLNKPLIIIPAGTENVGDFVTNCLKITSENGLVLIGRQGGYYVVSGPNITYSGNDSGTQPPISPQNYFTELGNITVPYYLYGNSLANMPSNLTVIENQLSLYVEENLDNCLNNFSIFKQKGFIVDAGTIDAKTTILDEKVRVSLDYPVTIKKVNITQQKTAYNIDVPLRLGLVYNLTRNMILNHTACPPVSSYPAGLNVDWSCSIAVRSNNFNFYPLKFNDAYLFVLTDNEYKLNNTYYDFIFAYKY